MAGPVVHVIEFLCQFNGVDDFINNRAPQIFSIAYSLDKGQDAIYSANLKIGQFSFSQQDVVIPVNGLPLAVTRTYNTLNPNSGDFGFG